MPFKRSPKQYGAIPPKWGIEILKNVKKHAHTFVIWIVSNYDEIIKTKEANAMKEKRYLALNDREQRLILLSLNRLRNRVIADGIDPTDVDRMMLKMAKLNKKRFGRT